MNSLSRLYKRIFGKLSKYYHVEGNITIITAASEAFYSPLRNIMLSSLLIHEPYADVIIWNLGLNDAQREDLYKLFKEHKGSMQLLTYPAEDLSTHYATLTTYSFKCYCIHHAIPLIKTRYALWLDTGSMIVDYLTAERNLIRIYGCYVSLSGHSVAILTHWTVQHKFQTEMNKCGNRSMLYAGLIGWDMKNKKVQSLLRDWYQLSQDEENIAPKGSSNENHRFDQSLLSLLYYRMYEDVPYLCKYRYNIRIQQKEKDE